MATAFGPPQERNTDATCYIGNLEQQVDEDLLWELFSQIVPVQNVYIPKDRITGAHSGYGFIEMKSEADADYAMNVLNGIKLYGKSVKVNKSSQDKKVFDVGANLFVGNLEPEVDDRILYHAFSSFGHFVMPPRVQRDAVTGRSKGFAFVSYDRFESSDAAIKAMHGQFLSGGQISVRYARKGNSKEYHGSQAERLLAASNPNVVQQQQQPTITVIVPQQQQQQQHHVVPPPIITPPPSIQHFQPPPPPPAFHRHHGGRMMTTAPLPPPQRVPPSGYYGGYVPPPPPPNGM